ncbi:MAG: glycosyltransferase family 39 protein [Acidobacteriota bacterium]
MLLTWAAQADAPVWDEPAHLAAGLAVLERGDVGLYRVNPPLVRTLAALPARWLGAATDWSKATDDPAGRPEFQVAQDFIRVNGSRLFALMTLGRLACLPLSLLGALACGAWARDLFGPWAGQLALALWCFSPSVLAHGHLITADLAGAALFILASWCCQRWLRARSVSWALRTGLAVGVALLAKHTCLLLVVLVPVLTLVAVVATPRGERRPRRDLGQLALVVAVAWLVVNLGYGFSGTGRRLGDFTFVSARLTGHPPAQGQAAETGNRFRDHWLGALPVPVPADLVRGVDRQQRDFDKPMRSYFDGRFHAGGWWWYYLRALPLKVPAGTWLVLAAAIGLAVLRPGARAAWRDELSLLLPPLLVLLAVSAQSNWSLHVRYVLPVVPFLFVIASRLVAEGAGAWRGRSVVASVGLTLALVSSLVQAPHWLSFVSWPAGGPARGPHHFVDSSFDWGQDLLHLKTWLDEHPEARPLNLTYFGSVDPRLAGIQHRLSPPLRPGDLPDPASLVGWHAISTNYLQGFQFPAHRGDGRFAMVRAGDYLHFQSLEPVGRAGRSILVYRIDAEMVTRLLDERLAIEAGS